MFSQLVKVKKIFFDMKINEQLCGVYNIVLKHILVFLHAVVPRHDISLLNIQYVLLSVVMSNGGPTE